ncbi:hypothetical protein O181_043554 [Austropuccinia psidii MF-1]|uniref:Uncharacterized protein n=1 Tax=Austropuccinia psidii MF-1 TaxID=1389203 RepID=A0A9Q3DI94_9BASI|nr:hypothetical protein [Austropuccinia psidii MF-1]
MANNNHTDSTPRPSIANQDIDNSENSPLNQHRDPLLIQPNSDITSLQLNCHNRYDSTLSILNSELTHVALLLQEPWINPPTHKNWHRLTPANTPKRK